MNIHNTWVCIYYHSFIVNPSLPGLTNKEKEDLHSALSYPFANCDVCSILEDLFVNCHSIDYIIYVFPKVSCTFREF